VELIQLDVDDEGSVERAVGEVLAREGGRIDVLVNNAGVAPFNPIERAGEAEAKAVFETNFFGALRMTRAVLPSMRKQRSGRIVNVSSVAGRVAPWCMGVYAASKFALEAASEALAQEVFAHGIRVAIVEPGIIVTPILGRAIGGLARDPDSPYAVPERCIHAIFSQGQQTGGDPRLVAQVIAEAVTAAEPRLRYTAGPDAEVFIRGRAGMSDEEWAAMGRHDSEGEYFREFAARFPMPS
jgi:NAD(P)-dependent dehydrogenase (short-subunit alcohol dehydrogenase family)